MPQEIRIWKIEDRVDLNEIRRSKLDLESRIESWIEENVSIISDDLLVIGRQLETEFGGIIDLLCIDPIGDLVIVELKRDKTPREITSQILDYASWVKDLSNDDVTAIAQNYFSGKLTLEAAFRDKFESELPDVINEKHKMIVIGTEIDSSTERIVRYLSENYGVGINAVTFQYFVDEKGIEYVANTFLIDPIRSEYLSRDKSKSKRRRPPSFEELSEIAEKNGVKDLFDLITSELGSLFDRRTTNMSSVSYLGLFDGRLHTIFHVIPGETDSVRMVSVENQNVLYFQFYVKRIADYFGIDENNIGEMIGTKVEDYYPWKSADKCYVGYFQGEDEINRFVGNLKNSKKSDGVT